MGSTFFIIYVSCLTQQTHRDGISINQFSDDTWALVIFSLSLNVDNSLSPSLSSLCSWRQIAEQWFTFNRVKPNINKDVFMICSSRFKSHLVQSSPLSIGDVSLPPSVLCKHLGVTIDSKLTLAPHVSRVCRVACFNLHRVSKIRHHLDTATTKQLIHAVVITHLDYCNAIFHGLSATLTNRLQRIQNNAARLILRVGRREHIRRHLAALHWLPIPQRSTHKIACIVYRSLCRCSSRPHPLTCPHGVAPQYLSSLLKIYVPSRSLRSQSSLSLVVPPIKTVTYGEASFSWAAPTIWNSLPHRIKDATSYASFRSLLKGHLFGIAFH